MEQLNLIPESVTKNISSFKPVGEKYPTVFAVVDPALNDSLRHRECHGPFKAQVRLLIKQPDAKIHLRRGARTSRYYFRITIP